MASLDILATLRPEHGVVQGVSIMPPEPPDHLLWTVAVDIGALAVSRVRGLDAADFPLHLVGACGPSRIDALVRGCGEAVERFALLNPAFPPAMTARAAELEDAALHCWNEGLAAPDAALACLSWYPGRRLRTEEVVHVPAPLVDYPPTDEQAALLFDPSPSGAAAGHGFRHALYNALLETVERDAVLSAWATQATLPRVDVDQALTVSPASVATRRLGELIAAARKACLEPALAQIPTAVPGLECVICAIVDVSSGEPLAAVGCRISCSLIDSLGGALREALQVRSVLIGIRRHYADRASPTIVTNDLDRARFWSGARAAAALEAWIATWPFVDVKPGVAMGDVNISVPQSGRDIDALVAALVVDGADPIVVDLTGRLPQPLRDMGWAAVKVIAPGYQPLVMDERKTWSWRPARLAALARRLGATQPSPMVCCVPHPLI